MQLDPLHYNRTPKVNLQEVYDHCTQSARHKENPTNFFITELFHQFSTALGINMEL